MSDIAATVGERLKAERERKGLSTQKAADELHLDSWVIDALESGDYARIGPSVYGKGHLKRYSALLGLPVDEIVSLYETRSRPQAAPTATPAPGLRGVDRPPLTLFTRPRVAVLGGIAAAIAVVGALLLVWRPWARSPTPLPPAAEVASDLAPSVADLERGGPAPVPADGRGAPERESANREFYAQKAGDPLPATVPRVAGLAADTSALPAAVRPNVAVPAAPAERSRAPSGAESTAGAGRARLRLSFSADSWVVVRDADGRRLFAGNGRANSVRTVAGVAPMRVFLGFASGVQLEVNNHAVAIGHQFMAGDEAHFEAGADGVLRHEGHPAAPANPHPRG